MWTETAVPILTSHTSGISKFQLSMSEIVPITIIIVDHNTHPVSLRNKLFSPRCVINGQFLTITCIKTSGKVKYVKAGRCIT